MQCEASKRGIRCGALATYTVSGEREADERMVCGSHITWATRYLSGPVWQVRRYIR